MIAMFLLKAWPPDSKQDVEVRPSSCCYGRMPPQPKVGREFLQSDSRQLQATAKPAPKAEATSPAVAGGKAKPPPKAMPTTPSPAVAGSSSRAASSSGTTDKKKKQSNRIDPSAAVFANQEPSSASRASTPAPPRPVVEVKAPPPHLTRQLS